MVLGGFRSFHVLVTTSRLNLRYSDVHVECEETAKNYLNGAFLMLTSLQILPVTVLTLESVLCPIKQGCFVQTLRARSLQAQKKWAVAQYRYVIFFPGKALCAVIDGKDLFDFIVCRLSVSFQSSSRHRVWMSGVNWNYNDNNGGRIGCRSSMVRCWCELECSFFRNKLRMFYKGNNNMWSKIEANCSNLLTRIELLLLQDWRQHMASFGEHGAITR